MKNIVRRHNNTGVKKNRKNKTHARGYKKRSSKYRRGRSKKNRKITKKYKGGNKYVNCSICNKKQNIENTLAPSTCFQKNLNKAHRICSDCWWDKFAVENIKHECPGCNKNLPLTNTQNIDPNEIIDLT